MTFAIPRDPSAKATRFEGPRTALAAGIIVCFGLIPSFHLAALQMLTLLMLVHVVLCGRFAFARPANVGIAHLFLAQFIIISALNAYAFTSLEGNLRHFRSVALESYAVTAVGTVLALVFVHRQRDLKALIIRWLPVGLILSFVTMCVFFFAVQGNRAQAFSPNALLPPIWFTALTFASFCWFHDLSRPHKILRLGLLALAAIMGLMSGGRMILLIWIFGSALLLAGLVLTRPNRRPLRDLALLVPGFGIALAGLLTLDALTGGTVAMRAMHTVNSFRDFGLSKQGFFRLELWHAALQIIEQTWPWGAGIVNEKYLLYQLVERDWWYRAHQTYLSYAIGGGVIGVVSGLMLQVACLGLLKGAASRRAFWPATLGLFAVPALNGLTESVFQSYLNVQVYVLFCIVFFQASYTEQATSRRDVTNLP